MALPPGGQAIGEGADAFEVVGDVATAVVLGVDDSVPAAAHGGDVGAG